MEEFKPTVNRGISSSERLFLHNERPRIAAIVVCPIFCCVYYGLVAVKNGLTATCKAAVPESVKTKGRVMVEERQRAAKRKRRCDGVGGGGEGGTAAKRKRHCDGGGGGVGGRAERPKTE